MVKLEFKKNSLVEKAWHNLVDHIFNNIVDKDTLTLDLLVNIELEKYNGVQSNFYTYLVFKTEEDSVQFLLTWL
jgi:hypothetical protein